MSSTGKFMENQNVGARETGSDHTARRRSSPIIERNMRVLAELADQQRSAKSIEDRFAMAVSRFAGQMNFVYIHVLVFGLWIIAHIGLHRFDPDLAALNTIATLEAIFLATFVLIAQNRLADDEEIRNHLDVQVSLLTEEETTHILRLVAKMGEKMGIDEANDPAIKQLVRKVEAQELIDQIGAEIVAGDNVSK